MLDFAGVLVVQMNKNLLCQMKARADMLDWPKGEQLTFLGIPIVTSEFIPDDTIVAVFKDRVEVIKVTPDCSETCLCQHCQEIKDAREKKKAKAGDADGTTGDRTVRPTDVPASWENGHHSTED